MPEDAHTKGGTLMDLLGRVPFERPIETFSEETLSAFVLKPVTHTQSMMIKKSTCSHWMDRHSVAKPVADDKQRKKEKKRKKREREEQEEMKGVFRTVIQHFSAKTWPQWVVHGKPSNPFMQQITPQNCASLGLPDYFDFVTIPMDLKTMQEKTYSDQEDFENDFGLIVSNAKAFNRPGEPVYEMAQELELEFKALYQRLIEQLQQERKRKKKLKKEKKSAKS